MVLIDTSSWIEALRPKGDARVKARVQEILTEGAAAWCDVVRAELWNGAAFGLEQKKIREFEKEVVRLQMDERVWNETIRLAIRARNEGLTVPVTDLIVFACAMTHDVELEHNNDDHFNLLAELK